MTMVLVQGLIVTQTQDILEWAEWLEFDSLEHDVALTGMRMLNVILHSHPSGRLLLHYLVHFLMASLWLLLAIVLVQAARALLHQHRLAAHFNNDSSAVGYLTSGVSIAACLSQARCLGVSLL